MAATMYSEEERQTIRAMSLEELVAWMTTDEQPEA